MPRPGNAQSVRRDSSRLRAIVSSSLPVRPAAYMAATKLPAEVPVTMSGWMPFSSSTSITPMWAKPRAAPPPSARATRGGRVGLGTSATAGAGAQTGNWSATGRLTGAVPQAVNSAAPSPARAAQAARRQWAMVGKRISIFLTSMIP